MHIKNHIVQKKVDKIYKSSGILHSFANEKNQIICDEATKIQNLLLRKLQRFIPLIFEFSP